MCYGGRMLLSVQKTIEDHTVELLHHGSCSTLDLIKKIREHRPTTSRQGVYRVLRTLRDEEVIVIHRKTISLNGRWLNELHQFSTLAQHYYFRNVKSTGNFAQLQEGEKISYTFNSMKLTDVFHNHAMYILLQIVPSQEHFFAYNPHTWFFYARPNDERAIMQTITTTRYYLVTAGHNTPLDKNITRFLRAPRGQYYACAQPLFPSENYYFNVLGPYIIEVWIHEDLAQDIHTWYQSTPEFTPHARNALSSIIDREAKTKLTISRNFAKAKRLRNKLKNFFFIPAQK